LRALGDSRDCGAIARASDGTADTRRADGGPIERTIEEDGAIRRRIIRLRERRATMRAGDRGRAKTRGGEQMRRREWRGDEKARGARRAIGDGGGGAGARRRGRGRARDSEEEGAGAARRVRARAIGGRLRCDGDRLRGDGGRCAWGRSH